MRNLLLKPIRRVFGFGVVIPLALAFSSGAYAQVLDPIPGWVPPEYHDFFRRRTDDRSSFQRALAHVPVDVGQTGGAFALVAGVSRYPRMSGPAADLAPARIDVEKMAAFLQSDPESFNEVVVLLDEDMTHENLTYFLTQYFPRRLSDTPRSRFLFAYSGHGITAENQRGYLLTSNAINLEDRWNGISLASLRADFQEVVDEGHQVLALINACYGSSFHRLSLAFGQEHPRTPRRPGAHAITAGGSGELVWHDKEFGDGSIFFEAVLKALTGSANQMTYDGVITVGELSNYLVETIKGFTDERQNPAFGDLVASRSPGGFYFFDRSDLVEDGIVKKFEFDPQHSFGSASSESVAAPTEAIETIPEDPQNVPRISADLLFESPSQESIEAFLKSSEAVLYAKGSVEATDVWNLPAGVYCVPYSTDTWALERFVPFPGNGNSQVVFDQFAAQKVDAWRASIRFASNDCDYFFWTSQPAFPENPRDGRVPNRLLEPTLQNNGFELVRRWGVDEPRPPNPSLSDTRGPVTGDLFDPAEFFSEEPRLGVEGNEIVIER